MVIIFEAAHTGLPSLVTDVIGQGVPYEIVGEADGVSWTVAAGSGIGATVQVSDPAAPFDVPTTYTVESDVPDVDWVERGFHGARATDTVLLSEDGRHSLTALFEGDAGMSWAPGSSFAQPLGSRFPVQHRPLSPGGPSWQFEGRVPLGEVWEARAALDRGRVWVAHSHARCVPDCPLPRVMLGGVDGSVSEGSFTDGRTYSLTLVQLDAGMSGVPIVTWGEAARAGITWAPATSFDTIRRSIAGGP